MRLRCSRDAVPFLALLESLLASVQYPNVLLSGAPTLNASGHQGSTLFIFVQNKNKLRITADHDIRISRHQDYLTPSFLLAY